MPGGPQAAQARPEVKERVRDLGERQLVVEAAPGQHVQRCRCLDESLPDRVLSVVDVKRLGECSVVR